MMSCGYLSVSLQGCLPFFLQAKYEVRLELHTFLRRQLNSLPCMLCCRRRFVTDIVIKPADPISELIHVVDLFPKLYQIEDRPMHCTASTEYQLYAVM